MRNKRASAEENLIYAYAKNMMCLDQTAHPRGLNSGVIVRFSDSAIRNPYLKCDNYVAFVAKPRVILSL